MSRRPSPGRGVNLSLGGKTFRLKKGTRRTVGLFLVVSLGVLYALIKAPLTSQRYLASENPLSTQKLTASFQSGGIESFRGEKARLKTAVEEALPGGQERAEPLAVYLFPELLPATHFEKSVAMDSWIPLQKTIEAQPGTDASRAAFDEMRAQIWIYENADSRNPMLSEVADEVVRVYDALSGKRQ